MQYTLKKSLGQHFLNDAQVCKDIQTVLLEQPIQQLLEVGPGAGALTKYIHDIPKQSFKAIELDREKVAYLSTEYPELKDKLILADILDAALPFDNEFVVVGNFPYNISSQILFHALDYVDVVNEVVGMFQKEVAERIASAPGSKEYGILSVLIQAYYHVEYMFTVAPGVFNPPPKVKSGVIKAVRRTDDVFQGVDPKLFKSIVKMGFNQRRKTLRNALRSYLKSDIITNPVFDLRAERLSVQDFVDLTKLIQNQ
jgi:16S rRNA (adenine1518-N6/adenine1519-N6)-dimethyltransferase